MTSKITHKIEKVERLLVELKQNIIELEKADTFKLLQLQEIVKEQYWFPKYPLNVRLSIPIYFMNQYAEVIYRELTNTNNGIPLKTIINIMNKHQPGEEVK